MKKIACVGYHDTGASVVDDLLRECDNVAQGVSNAELRVLHDPDGISDLEYHLVIDPHRSGSSLAIRRFIAYCKRVNRMESKLVGSKWLLLSTEYAKSLANIYYRGWMTLDVLFFPYWKKKLLTFYLGINKLLPKSIRKQRWHNFFPQERTYYAGLTEEEFLSRTKDYIDSICEIMNPEHLEYLVLDQFASSHNPANAMRYTNDLKVIVVDRDPRDLYIHDVKMLQEHILAPEPLNFAIQYRRMRRKISEEESPNVLHVRYEELIWEYDITISKIFQFLEIDPSVHHVSKKKFFNPAVSINGTQLWKRFPQYAKEIEIISKELSDMLYQYPANDDVVRSSMIAGGNVNELQHAFDHMDDV